MPHKYFVHTGLSSFIDCEFALNFAPYPSIWWKI
jgi:hypothetical protein